MGRRSARLEEAAFVVEGATLLGEALDAGVEIECVLVEVGTDDPTVQRAAEAGVVVIELAAGVMAKVATTTTPQPVMAVLPRTDVTIDALEGASLIVVCAAVRDPGNLGTVLRSAEAAGAGGIVCCDGSVDVFNPKTVRASAGSLFHVPVVAGGDAVEVLERMRTWGVRRWGTAAAGGVAYDSADLTGPTALVLGNEAWGLPTPVAANVDGLLSIPMTGRTESLNVGMAAAIVCFEAARQRRHV